MARQCKAMLYFFCSDVRHSFTIFWMVLLSIVVTSLILATVMPADWSMYFTISVPVYVYCSILGFKTVKESLPFTVKMGGTRKNYFLALGIFFAGMAVLLAVMISMLHLIVGWMVQAFSITGFDTVHLAAIFTTENEWLYLFAIDFFIIFLLQHALFFLGLIFYRFGLIGGFQALGVVVLALIVTAASGQLTDVIINAFVEPNLSYYVYSFVAGWLFYLLSWLLLRKTPALMQKAS